LRSKKKNLPKPVSEGHPRPKKPVIMHAQMAEWRLHSHNKGWAEFRQGIVYCAWTALVPPPPEPNPNPKNEGNPPNPPPAATAPAVPPAIKPSVKAATRNRERIERRCVLLPDLDGRALAITAVLTRSSS
jgi:hypothetical protein